jgi:hypothetical protein
MNDRAHVTFLKKKLPHTASHEGGAGDSDGAQFVNHSMEKVKKGWDWKAYWLYRGIFVGKQDAKLFPTPKLGMQFGYGYLTQRVQVRG